MIVIINHHRGHRRASSVVQECQLSTVWADNECSVRKGRALRRIGLQCAIRAERGLHTFGRKQLEYDELCVCTGRFFLRCPVDIRENNRNRSILTEIV